MRYARGGVAGFAVAAAMAAAVAPAAVRAQAPAFGVDLPAGPLGDSLRAVGQTSQQQIIFSEDDVRGLQAPALRGKFTVDEAMARLLAGTPLRATRTASGVISIAGAGQVAPTTASGTTDAAGLDVVVTGSRIRRADPATAAPVTRITGDQLTERGFVQAGDMLNVVTSNVPELPQAPFSGFPAGSGQTFPNLFGLGDGRTLTLLNGRRMVTSATGLGARVVDVNIIPAGLIDRIDVVQAGGAAVYGSDAIAGVVNYVLKRNFSGLELDVQDLIASRGTFSQPFARVTAGRNFGGGRGNIAVDAEYSRTNPLLETDVPYFERSPRSVTNAANTSQSDGQPPTVIVYGGRLWRFNRNGVLFTRNATAASNLLLVNGRPAQISPDGQGIIPYDTGVIQFNNSSTAIGGEGNDPRLLSTFITGVERYTGSAIGRYDLTDHVHVTAELIYGHTRGDDLLGTQDIVRNVGGGSTFAAVSFTRANPYLTQAQVDTLSAASPSFAAGGPLVLSKFYDGILPTRESITVTDTGRGLLAVNGEFMLGARNFYWSASGSHGETESTNRVYAQYFSHFNNAVDAVRNAAGQIVCRINADAITTNDDPTCAPINIFGPAQSAAARAYVSTLLVNRVRNKQDDYLATLGGEIVRLPGGAAQFSVAYEHRRESARFTVSDSILNGDAGFSSVPEAGAYHTNEYSAELLVPLVGGDFTLPLVQVLEATGSFRHVDNSLAGKQNVWGGGLRWTVGLGLTLRGSRSRNFSAPTLDQQFAPTNVAPGNPANDPCDVTQINSGSNPAARLANCQKLFAANPGYGPLATFSDPSQNTGTVAITTRGNPNLRNEVSNTLTLGGVIEPSYIPGLSLSADYIRVDLRDALSPFGANDFLAACYDNVVQPADICATFTRNAQGYLVTAISQTFNAGSLRYRGEVYKANYHLPLSRWFGGDPGSIDFHVEATHNRFFETSVTGFDRTRSDGTVTSPHWRGRFDLNYARGPFRAFYSLYYLPDSKANYFATIETTPVPVLKSNTTHTISFQYDVARAFTIRFGINNFTDRTPPLPSRTYGDIYGRRFFAGARVRF